MKKILLLLLSSAIFYVSYAQNSQKCLTCKNGMHDGINRSPNNQAQALNMKPGKQTPNGNATFGLSYVVQNLCGLNYIINGLQTTTRYVVPGTGFPTTISMVGLPAGFLVQKAYVYYGVSYTEVTPPPTSVVITNPALVTSTIPAVMIGDGHSVCWGETGTATYRCDISSMISGNGNYVINLTGFLNAAYEVDGVSIIIMYVDPNATYSGNIAIWDGDMANWTGTSMTYTGDGFTACTNSSAGSAFSLAGDCQNNFLPSNTDNYNGSIGTFSNNFWNTNVLATSVSACDSTTTFTGYTNNSGDCWLWSAIGLYWQYPTCSSCGSLTVTDVSANPSCGNNTGSITVNVTGGTSPYTYSWSPNVSSSASATGLAPGTYQITVHDAACNVQTVSVTLTMINFTTSDTVTDVTCNGQANGSISFTVTGGTSPYTYLWSPNTNSTASATGLSAGTYTVYISDSTGCQHTINVTVTQPAPLSVPITPFGALCNGMADGSAVAIPTGGTSPYKYSWSNGQNIDTAKNLSAGSYSVTVTDKRGCTANASVVITEPSVLSVALTGPAIICDNSTGTLRATPSGGTPGYKYTWSGPDVNASTSDTATIKPGNQTDTVKVTDANGCTATAEITVQLGPDMSVTITGPGSICQGLSTTLCANVTGGTGGNMYSWQPGNAQTPCAVVSPSSTTTYTLTVVDNCGTVATATATLRINPLPVTAFTSSLFAGCSPLCVQFFNTTTLAQGNSSTYLWTFGDGDSSRIQSPEYCYSTSGSYNVSLTVTSDSGCANTLNKISYITAYSKPNTAFTYSPQPATMLTPTVQFINQSNDTYSIVSWIWNFGDGTDSVSNAANPSHTYQDTGRYCVSLIAMDEHGCSDTVTNCFVMEPNFTLYIPSAFTPNNDRVNDVFKPVGQYIKSFEMYIFDRWGMQLYHTTDITKGWDGTVGGGTPAQEDTYVYKILVTDSEGHSHTYVGNVTLLK